MSTISTHILDTAAGTPAAGLDVALARRGEGGWQELVTGRSDSNGRIATLVPDGVGVGDYRLTFATGPYLTARGIRAFYPEVCVVFTVTHTDEHYHVPLLLSPYGYSTYRGS